jgi:hypothetical protein
MVAGVGLPELCLYSGGVPAEMSIRAATPEGLVPVWWKREAMTRLMSAAAAIAVLALSATTASAAGDGVSISKVSGGVLVNQGQGFKPATPGMVLHPGDRVLVTASGQAGLNFAGGCGVSLGGGSMATISTASPCTAGARNAGIVTPMAQTNTVSRNSIGGGGGPIGILHGLGGGGQSSSPP